MFHLSKIIPKISLIEHSVSLQIVRYKRKPIGAPKAKSKLYKVPEKPQLPKDELEELRRINNNYKNHMKSIKRFLVANYASKEKLDDTDHKNKVAYEDYEICAKINDEWNAKVGVEREKFFEGLLNKDIEVAKKKLEFQQFKKVLDLEEAEKIVREVKEEAKGFITAENIDEAIEKALSNPVDHNFSIDLEGNRFYGRESVPEMIKK
nr:probable 28S ribosomal protein S26, mitochondrial [Onthophagus taurus]